MKLLGQVINVRIFSYLCKKNSGKLLSFIKLLPMRKFLNSAAAILSVILLMYGCEGIEGPVEPDFSNIPDTLDITDEFDPLFAQMLEERGYIPDASVIRFADVRYLNNVDVSAGSEDGGSLNSVMGIRWMQNLETFICSGQSIQEMDLTDNLFLNILDCSNNQISKLDLSGNEQLVEFSCSNNKISELTLDRCFSLEELNCENMMLTELDLSNCRKLRFLQCSNNAIVMLDVSKNHLLDNLFCSGNSIKDLNISENVLLGALECSDNSLKSLNISSNNRLLTLGCSGNPGDGSIFLLNAWFGEEYIPLTIYDYEWEYNGHTVSVKINQK